MRRLSDRSVVDVTVAEVAGERAVSQQLDLALLAVSELGGWGETSPIHFGRVDRSHGGELSPCNAIGFPRWQIDRRGEIRGVAQIDGLIRLAEDPGDGAMVLRDRELEGVRAQGAQSPWAGVSGALVFHEGVAIGVVVEHHANQGGAALRVRPLDLLLSPRRDAGAGAIATLLRLIDLVDVLDPGYRARDSIEQQRLTDADLYVWDDDDIAAGLEIDEHADAEPIDARQHVDVVLLRERRLPNLQVEFGGLVNAFEKWSTAGYRKEGGEAGLRVFWLVGEPGLWRGKARLACLAWAGGLGHAICDVEHDVRSIGRAMEAIAGAPPELVPAVVSANLRPPARPDQPDPHDPDWREFADVVTGLRRRRRSKSGQYPLLVIAGTAAQEQCAYDRLSPQVTVEFEPRDTKGREHQRPGSDAGADELTSPSLSREHVFNRGLPATTRQLFGREDELRDLRRAWSSRHVRIGIVRAYGGTGKSALVNTWLRDMREHDYRGATKVLAWSFYSQGTKDNLVSADPFVSFALSWLGDDAAMQSLNPHARGERLADLIIEQGPMLLVLDGLEPLQYPPSAPNVGGQITDGSIKAMLKRLAGSDWGGLCVITTRVDPTDLKMEREKGTVRQWELENLDPVAAAGLLRSIIGGNPASRDLADAVKDVDYHALAVTLLGNYLRDVHQGSLAYRRELEVRTVEVEEGGHARRVMASYEKWLRRGGRDEELAVLRIIGLFDRPAPPDALGALFDVVELAPALERLERVGSPQWNNCVAALRHMSLLNREIKEWPGTIDAHPLVREHFRERLRGDEEGRPWRSGNRALYDYYQGIAPWQPSRSDGMSLLYSAVTHGCAAELYQQVFDELLLKRIWRDRRTNFSTRRLGMTGSEIVALSNYFAHHHWTQLRKLGLSPQARVLIMTNAGVRLRQLGRTLDAEECFAAVLQQQDPGRTDPDDLQDAAYAAAQYCELLVIAGRLEGPPKDPRYALEAGAASVGYAERANDPYFLMHAHSCLGEVYLMLGKFDEARKRLLLARRIGEERKARPHFLYSQSLYRYGYLLIETGQAAQVLVDAENEPEWGTNGSDSSLLSHAIQLLIRGAAHRALLADEPPTSQEREHLTAEAERYLDESVSTLRTVGYSDYIVRGLVERAHFRRVCGRPDDYAKAQADLDAAEFEAKMSRMDLLHVDVLLEQAASFLGVWPVMGNTERASVGPRIVNALQAAGQGIERIRYSRRSGMHTALREKAKAYGLIS